MLYFQMRTNNIDGIMVEEMLPCEGWENETVFRLNERLNPTLTADILANPTKYWFDANGVLWQRATVSNLFADADMEAADMAAWTVNAGGGTGTAVKNTGQCYDGTQSALLTGGDLGIVVTQALGGSGNRYTLYAHVYTDGTAPPEANFRFIANGEEVVTEYTSSAKAGWFKAVVRNIAWSTNTWGFKVAAGTSVYVDAVSMNIADTEVDVTPPATPTGLVASSIIGGLRITHDPNTEDDLAGYEIHVAATATGMAKGLTNPSVAPTLSQGINGSVADGIYYAKYTWNNGIGETQASTSTSIEVSGGGGTASIGVQVSAFPHGCSKIKVYVSTDGSTFYYDGESTTSNYMIIDIPNSGDSPPASNTTIANSIKIADTLSNWPDDVWKDGTITIMGGTGSGQTRTISGNSETEITITQAWATTPDGTSTYSLLGPYALTESGMKTKWEILSLERRMSYNVKVRAYDTTGNYSLFTDAISCMVGYDQMRLHSTWVIAAPDSKRIDYADFVTGSTNAQNIINGAVSLLPNVGGRIVLLEGTFACTGAIVLPSNVVIEGQGASTIIRVPNGVLVYTPLITNSNTGNGNERIVIRSLYIDGNRTSAGRGPGIELTLVTDCDIEGIQVVNAAKSGICLYEAQDCRIKSNHCSNNGWHGIAVWQHTGAGMRSYNISALNNICESNFVGIDLMTDESLVSGNMGRNNTWHGIRLTGDNNQVEGNMCPENKQHGIRILDADHNLIINNRCLANGQEADNTYANILVENGYYNVLQGNLCRRGILASKSKYGIRIEAIANNTIISNNDCYTGGSTSGISSAASTTLFGAGNRNNDGTWSTTPN